MQHQAQTLAQAADQSWRPGVDNNPADNVGDQIPFTPDINEGAQTEVAETSATPVPVTQADNFFWTAEHASHDLALNQGVVGGANQQVVQQIVPANPARRKVTIQNIGTVPIFISITGTASATDSSFILTNAQVDPLAGASITLAYRGAIFAGVVTTGTQGRYQFAAEGYDG